MLAMLAFMPGGTITKRNNQRGRSYFWEIIKVLLLSLGEGTFTFINHSMHRYSIHTDGSCKPTNPGRGGWASIILDHVEHSELVLHGCFAHTTNNRMEAYAILESLDALFENGDTIVYSDSEYVLNALNLWCRGWSRNGWKTKEKKPVKNIDMWQWYLTNHTSRSIKFIWNKGHAGNEYNERCDKMANWAVDNDPEEKDVMYMLSLMPDKKIQNIGLNLWDRNGLGSFFTFTET